MTILRIAATWLLTASALACGGATLGGDAGSDAEATMPDAFADVDAYDGADPEAHDPAQCHYARATWYPIYRESGIPQGTCGFGPVADDMPTLFRAGYVTAPNEVFYNRAPEVGGTCGECYEITGSTGVITVMSADICDIACCDNCRGDVTSFDIDEAVWDLIVDQPGGNVAVAYHWVPCPVEGNVRLFFSAGEPNPYWFRLTFYNHRVGIRSAEVRGDAAGATGGEWVPLERNWTNGFDWAPEPPADVGLPIAIRVTSTAGETIEFPPIETLRLDDRHDSGAQFEDLPAFVAEACPWPGPEPWVFRDALGGLAGIEWRDWGSWGLGSGRPDYARAEGCAAGSACIEVGPIDAWGAIQVGNPNFFPIGFFTAVELRARTDGASFERLEFFLNGKDAAGGAASTDHAAVGPLTGEWQSFRIEIGPLAATVDRARVLLFSNQSNTRSPAILLDEIRLVR
jgi:hypothetical protein